MIFIKVFQELSILILILGDKEAEKYGFRLHVCGVGDKNESTAELGRGEQGRDERVSKAGEEYARKRAEPQRSSKTPW